MITAKEKIEQTLKILGIEPVDAWQEEDQWFLLENNGQYVIVREKEASIENSNDKVSTVNIFAPVITIPETMPLDFYKEIFAISNDIADGTSLQIENNKTLIMSIYILNEFYTADFGIQCINNIIFWAKKLKPNLEWKYKDSLF